MTLPASIASPEDLQAVIQELKEYATWSAHVAIRQKALKDKGHSKTSSPDHATNQPMLSGAAKALIHDQSRQAPLTGDSIDQLIADIGLLAANAPHFTITLAAPATPGVRKSLVTWCRDNISPDVLVSFAFSRVILGGMVVRSGSHIHDWSHRRAILEHAPAFPETFKQLAGPPDTAA